MSKKTQIKVTDVLNMLTQGYTRTNDNKKFNPEIGSIQDHYGLTVAEIKHLFTHPLLVGRKTITPVEYSFEIVEEEVAEEVETETVA